MGYLPIKFENFIVYVIVSRLIRRVSLVIYLQLAFSVIADSYCIAGAHIDLVRMLRLRVRTTPCRLVNVPQSYVQRARFAEVAPRA